MTIPRINRIATDGSDKDPQAIMNAEQIGQRFGYDVITSPPGTGVLLPNRHYRFATNYIVSLPTITAALNGSNIHIIQAAGVSTISYTIDSDVYTTTLNAGDNTTGGGVWIQFRAVYVSPTEHYWLDVTRINSTTVNATPSITDISCVGALTVFPIAENIPSDYLVCDGSVVLSALYPDLCAFLGDRFDDTPPDGYFRLPNYSGKFLRVWDNGAGIDPDADTRGDRGDGTVGDQPGTTQGEEFKEHTHTYVEGVNTPIVTSGDYNREDGQVDGVRSNPETSSAGGNETRPVNVSVVVCIRAKITNMEAVPEIELLMVKGQALTGDGYFDENTEVGAAYNANAYIDYMDNIGEGHTQTIASSDATPWGNFFPYRPTTNTSKTTLKYTVHGDANADSGDNVGANYIFHIDWYNRLYSCQITTTRYYDTYPGKTIMLANQPFGVRVIDVSNYGTDEVSADNNLWTTIDATIEITDAGIIKLPLHHLDVNAASVIITMEITNYKTTITESGVSNLIFLTDANPTYTLPLAPLAFSRYRIMKHPSMENDAYVYPPSSDVELSGRTEFAYLSSPYTQDWASLELMATDPTKWATVNIHHWAPVLQPPYTLTLWVMMQCANIKGESPNLVWYIDYTTGTKYLLAAMQNSTRNLTGIDTGINWKNLHAYNPTLTYSFGGGGLRNYNDGVAWYPMIFNHVGGLGTSNVIRNPSTPSFVFPPTFTNRMFTLRSYIYVAGWTTFAIKAINGRNVLAYDGVEAYSCPTGPTEWVWGTTAQRDSNMLSHASSGTKSRTFDITKFELE